MHNTIYDLMMLSSLGIMGRLPKAPAVLCAPGSIIGGGGFRDSFGVFRGCFAIYYSTGFAFEAELATVFYAIEIAQENGWTTVWMECDSTYVVQIFRAPEPNIPWRHLAHWHKIRRITRNMQLVVSHIYRECNATADRLTREKVDLFKWWVEAPDFLYPFLQKDLHNEFYRFTL
ncbi:hypothetical protein ACS0TY_031359 [Phlomoides rotata]